MNCAKGTGTKGKDRNCGEGISTAEWTGMEVAELRGRDRNCVEGTGTVRK